MSIITTIEDLRVLANDPRNGLDLTMAFCGLREVRDVDRNILLPGIW